MSAKNIHGRVRAIVEGSQRLTGAISAALHRETGLTKVETELTKFEKAAHSFAESLKPPPAAQRLTDKECVQSLTDGAEAIAREKAAVLLTDAELHAQVTEHAPAEHREFWHTESQGLARGHMQSNESLRTELRSRGILAWFTGSDRLTRLVDTQWLSTHEEIFAFVNSEAEPGRRCRFCRLAESPASTALIRADPENDHSITHSMCQPFWMAWKSIAAQYTDAGAAKAADKDAGRKPGQRAPLPELLPEPQSVTDATFGSSKEQGIPPSEETPWVRYW